MSPWIVSSVIPPKAGFPLGASAGATGGSRGVGPESRSAVSASALAAHARRDQSFTPSSPGRAAGSTPAASNTAGSTAPRSEDRSILRR